MGSAKFRPWNLSNNCSSAIVAILRANLTCHQGGLWHSHECNFTLSAQGINQWKQVRKSRIENCSHISRGQLVNYRNLNHGEFPSNRLDRGSAGNNYQSQVTPRFKVFKSEALVTGHLWGAVGTEIGYVNDVGWWIRKPQMLLKY